jgi:N-methylhydantoinase B/oxoprolinase/acetone carboxylase alpha subunit
MYAYTAYALKCALDPNSPNSDGSFTPITVSAPLGSILNPRQPAAVNGRNLVGHMLPSLVFKALADVLPFQSAYRVIVEVLLFGASRSSVLVMAAREYSWRINLSMDGRAAGTDWTASTA